MFSEDTLANIVARMESHADEFRAKVRLKSYNLEEESFILELGPSESEEIPWAATKFTCQELIEDITETRELVLMEHKTNKDGWLMEPIPALMFAAMYAG